MRYPAAEKLEIIQLVEQSHLPVRQLSGVASSVAKGRPEGGSLKSSRLRS